MVHDHAGPILIGSYDYWLVALSVVIAILAAYAALDLARRVTIARGKERALWLAGGATAMGFGIWSMHYIGMLAFRLPIPVQYDWPTVLLSLIAAVLAAAIALFVVSRRSMSFSDALLGSVLMGAGIATMHFVGMEAMRMPAMCLYSQKIVALSVLLAIVISMVALWLTFHFREDTSEWNGLKMVSAVVMGLAIPVMHYTGMAAVTFVASDTPHGDLSHAVSVSSLSVAGIGIVTFVVLGTVLLVSLRFESLPTVRQLAKRYFVSLGAIGLFAIFGTLLVQHQGREAQADARLINVAGRQRMLSQAIAKDSLLLSHSHDVVERRRLAADLRSLSARWKLTHFALRQGDSASGMQRMDEPVGHMLSQLEPHFAAMLGAAQRLADKTSMEQASADLQAEVDVILAHEQHFLAIMNSIVFAYEHDARMRSGWKDQLYLILLCSILGGLLMQGLVVLRPALIRIQRGIRQLERTKQSLHRKATFVELLQVVASAANGATSFDEVLQFTIDEICKRTGWPVGHVYVCGTRGELTPSTLWHLEDPSRFQTFREITSRTPLTLGAGLPGRVAQRAQPAWIPDINQDDNFPRRAVAVDLGVKGAFAFPVLAQNEVVAVLEFFSRDIEKPDRELLTVMSNIGVQLGQVVERTRAQERVARNAEELARSNAELEQFAYVASHDLQEPLRMVASYTQLLARRYRGKLDADADEFIAFAVDGATRMQTLIRDLLSYSRLTSKARALEPVDAGVAAGAAIGNLQTSIGEAGADVSVGGLPNVLADTVQLTQLFQNLIGNAIKYCEERRPQIHVDAKSNGSAWVFSVRDNGIGIDPQYFERIFQMFQRLHTREEYSGTGIGLAICRKIVERHGGRIWVESQPGQGSTFLFTLPQAVGAEA